MTEQRKKPADKKKQPKVKITFTEEQRSILSKAFGPKWAKRIKDVDIELVADFMKADLTPN